VLQIYYYYYYYYYYNAYYYQNHRGLSNFDKDTAETKRIIFHIGTYILLAAELETN